MRAKSVLRTIIAATAAVLLLLPAIVTAYVWTPVNLGVSLLALAVESQHVVGLPPISMTPGTGETPSPIVHPRNVTASSAVVG